MMTFKAYCVSAVLLTILPGAHATAEAAAVGTRGGGIKCETVVPLDPFNVETYASARWYVHEQSKTSYSNPTDTCVRADYTVLDEPTSPWKYTVGVNNQLGKDENNNAGKTFLCAYQVRLERRNWWLLPALRRNSWRVPTGSWPIPKTTAMPWFRVASPSTPSATMVCVAPVQRITIRACSFSFGRPCEMMA
jgi:hypothetical protein